jgi:hypothetical protein
MRDLLIGKWLFATRKHDRPPACSRRGEVIGKPGGGVWADTEGLGDQARWDPEQSGGS